jgi:hypothetical protein
MSQPQSARSDLDVESNNDNPSKAGKLANFVIDNVLGFHSGAAKRKFAEIPDGHTIGHTGGGQIFLQKLGDDITRAEEARNEHMRPGATTSWRSSFGTLADAFGEGVFQYFDFLVFLAVTNAFMLIPGVISMIPHFVFDEWKKSELQKNFYIVMYSAKSYKFWWWPVTISCGMILLTFGPAIAYRISSRFRKKNIVDTEDEFLLPRAADVIKDKTGLAANPPRKQLKRFALSYFLFLLLLGVSGVLTMGFVAAQYYAFGNTFLASILVAVIVTIFNTIWTQVCMGLTLLEAHYTWTAFKNHHTLKLFVWKILNVCLMFLGQWLVTKCYLREVPLWGWIFNVSKKGGFLGAPSIVPIAPTPFVLPPDAPPDFVPMAPPPSAPVCTTQCEIGNLGNQFISLLIADLVLGNIIRLAWPFFGWKMWGCFTGKGTSRENDSGRIEFDLALNYLDLLYRQFVLYLGTPFVPFLPVLGIFINLVQIPVDKWRLLKWCKTPPRLSGSMKHFLVFFLLISALVSIAVFPYGTAWVLSDFTLQSTCPNTIFGKSSNASII